MSSALPRMEIRLPQELKDQVLALAATRGVSASEIGLAALQELLEKGDSPDRAVLHRLTSLERLLAGFIRVFFTLTPASDGLSDAARQDAARRGRERWERLQALIASEEAR